MVQKSYIMKILLTLFVLLFSNQAVSETVYGDIFDFLKQGYKIISVVSPTDKGILTYILSYKDKDIIQCTYTITGVKLYCFSLDKD